MDHVEASRYERNYEFEGEDLTMAELKTVPQGLHILEDEGRTGDGGTSSKTVEVRGFSLDTSHDLLEMYFENTRRSGGGDIEEIEIKDDVAYITFEEPDVVHRVVSHSSHQVAGQTLTVTLFCPPLQKLYYRNRVLVQRLNSAVTEELLNNFLETETGIKVTEFLYGENEGKVVVTFSNFYEFAALRKACNKRRLEGTFLQVTKVTISNCILVKNIQPSVSHDIILFYFESKRSGGGEVEKVEMNTAERYCLVYFVDHNVIDTVLCQHHKIDGVDIDVHLHHECLGRRSSRCRSDPFLRMSTPEMKDNLLKAETSNSNSSNPDTGCDFVETLLKVKTSSSNSSNPDMGCDFVETPKWQEDDGKNCVLPLLIKYKRVSERMIIKSIKEVTCSWNFHVFWNFFTKTKQGQNMLDDIFKKSGCSVTVSSDDDDLFIFEISDDFFEKESEVIQFIKDAMGDVYACALQSLFSDILLVDHRILEDVLQTIKQTKEMDNAWIELIGEQEPDAICVVCTEQDKASILQVVTAIKTAVQECFENHEDVVTIDPVWQKVLKKFGYLQEISEKFPNLKMTPDETKATIMLKGARDQTSTAAKHLLELVSTAHAEVQEDIFSPGCQFEIFAYPEMCDYIDNSIIKLPAVYIPNHLTKKIHLFSKKSEQIMGMDKFIKGCIKEKSYPLTKDQSALCPKITRSLEDVKKMHEGKIVINQSPKGLIMTAADDIFESVDAVLQEIVSTETDNVDSAHVTEKHVKRDGHLVNKSGNNAGENQEKAEDSLWSKRNVISEQNKKNYEGLKSVPDVNFDHLEVMIQPEITVKPSSDDIGKTEDRKKSRNAKILKLRINYLKKQGEKTETDVSKHLVSCSFNFQLMWNFYTQTDCGRNMLDVIAAKHHCKVSLPPDEHLKEFFIFQVLDVHFQKESDVKTFVDCVLVNIYICAEESLSIDSIGVDPRIQNNLREKLKEREELNCAWIELADEEETVTIYPVVKVYTVCCKDQQQFVMQIITEEITNATKSINSHIEMVKADFMWQMVMTRFEYLKELCLKFPSTEIINDKNLNAFLLKGPRDDVKAAAGHLEELLKMAHKEVHEEVFSTGYQFEIFASSEMCDYIDNSLPKLPVVWIPNHLTKEIHIFSRDPKQLKGIDTFIKDCVAETFYPLSEDCSTLPSEKILSLKELKKKHMGKIVIHLSEDPTGLLVTTADSIFKYVDAAVQEIIRSEIDEVHLETCDAEKLDGRDGQLGSKPQLRATDPDKEMKDLFSEKVSDSVEEITKSLEVKDKSVFRKLLIEHMEKFNQIAKEHCVSIEVSKTQSRVGFEIKGLEKEVQHICEIINKMADLQMQLQQDIRVTDGNAEKVPTHKSPSPNAAENSQGNEMSEEMPQNPDRCELFSADGQQSLKVTTENVSTISDTHMEPPTSHLHGSKGGHESQKDACPICLETPVDPKAFNECGHVLCSECMELTVKKKPVCPVCGRIYGIITGNQPKGTMKVKTTSSSLPGFRNCGTIDILYSFPGGIQTEEHPNPGKPFQGIKRCAYLPDNIEGRKVLRLLRKAFDRRLVFTIGQSVTTGTENAVTWNDIHHKTSTCGGPQKFGYPDPDYLRRVQEELAAKGVTEDT